MCTGASDNCGNVYSGTYRPFGDGGLPFAQGGGDRAGVMLFDLWGGTWVLAVKTADSMGSTSWGCTGAGLQNGPGFVGQLLLLPFAGCRFPNTCSSH